MCTNSEDIESFLSAHFPFIPIGWLKEVNDSLKFFTDKNGGNVEMTTRFSKGIDDWTDWKERRINRQKK